MSGADEPARTPADAEPSADDGVVEGAVVEGAVVEGAVVEGAVVPAPSGVASSGEVSRPAAGGRTPEHVRPSVIARAEARVRRASVSASAPNAVQDEGEWLITYLDMMTLTLVFLVVMLALSGRNGAEPSESPARPASEETDPEEVNPDLSSLLEWFEGERLVGVEVVPTSESVRVRLPSETLFETGRADLSLEGVHALRRIVPRLLGGEFEITVEGHSDTRPIRSMRFPSNWELSSARAGSVVRYLQANGVPSARLRALGLADTHPLAGEDTEQGRARNRRVELSITVLTRGPEPAPEEAGAAEDADPSAAVP